MKLKALDIFKKFNSIQFNDDDVNLNYSKLSGITNEIYKIEISSDKYDHLFTTKIILFKTFGILSEFFNRELEVIIMNKLEKFGLAAKIYETDNKKATTIKVDLLLMLCPISIALYAMECNVFFIM